MHRIKRSLSVDEKSQIQALDRTQPILPLRSSLPDRRTGADNALPYLLDTPAVYRSRNEPERGETPYPYGNLVVR